MPNGEADMPLKEPPFESDVLLSNFIVFLFERVYLLLEDLIQFCGCFANPVEASVGECGLDLNRADDTHYRINAEVLFLNEWRKNTIIIDDNVSLRTYQTLRIDYQARANAELTWQESLEDTSDKEFFEFALM